MNMRDSAIEMAKRLIIDSIWKSANLEGLGTTFPKTEAILMNVPTHTSTEEVLFIINMKRAWNFLFDVLDYPTTLSVLREFNKIAGDGLFSNNGAVRTIPVQIGGTDWEPEMPHEGTIIEDMERILAENDPETAALKMFCFVARTQIFIDGNKRVAQLIANKILIENDIGIFQIPIKLIEEFKTLLIKFYETNNDTKIIPFLRENCIKYVQSDETLVKTKSMHAFSS